MNSTTSIPGTVFGLENSSTDANRFYSILLDARAVQVSANMCDIAEKLVAGEKDNAKAALEQLWALKKNLGSGSSGTVDLLIRYYQDKIDVLRGKEEHIKRVSKDSRGLLEEKRKKDEEIASVKQQIGDCTREIRELQAKFEKLTIKEAELSLIEQQLKKELDGNENEIVNGLYEIIISQGSDEGPALEKAEAPAPGPASEPAVSARVSLLSESVAESDDATPVVMEPSVPLSQVKVREEKPPFPRSIVKTTEGKVIGEYFFDSTIAKEARHYIFSSRFFARVAGDHVRTLKTRFDMALCNELLQMIQDSYKRIIAGGKFHFEVSTNEILNEKTLKQLWIDARNRSFDEVEAFCSRLLAKTDAMGSNYRTMLQEQMERCVNG